MKKIFAFILAVMMVLSLTALCACENSDNTVETIAENLTVAGEWKVVSTDDEIEWHMNSQGVLHITEIRREERHTTVCKYTYDKETKVFEYTGLSADVSYKGELFIDEADIILTSLEDGEVIRLQRIE